MLLAGLKLMFIGMATVLLFLLLMIVLIQVVSRLTVNIAAKELEAIKNEKLERARRANEIKLSEEGEIPIAVFTDIAWTGRHSRIMSRGSIAGGVFDFGRLNIYRMSVNVWHVRRCS